MGGMKKLIVENSQSLHRLVDIPFFVTVYHEVTSQRYPGLRTLSSGGTIRLRPIASHQGILVTLSESFSDTTRLASGS